MWYLQHRLFAQVVALPSDGAFTCMDEDSEHKSNWDSRACRGHKVTRCLIRYLEQTQPLPESQREGGERALLLMLPVFVFTPRLHQGCKRSRLLGPALAAPCSCIPIFEGMAELFHACATRFLFEIFFKLSKVAWKYHILQNVSETSDTAATAKGLNKFKKKNSSRRKAAHFRTSMTSHLLRTPF